MSLEVCDSPQSFFFLHSMGGGTGSGLGTYSLAQIHDEFPDMYRFVSRESLVSRCCGLVGWLVGCLVARDAFAVIAWLNSCAAVFPSEEDDVVTSPYNSALAIAQLNEHADCVLPVENSALAAIVAQATKLAEARGGSRAGGGARASATPDRSGSSTAFDSMNELAARMLTGLTAGMRFSGPLNVDLNEITTNLVPFSGMHYLVPSLSPAVTMAAAGILRSRRSALPGKPLRAASSAAAAAASGRAGPGRLLPGEPRSADALFSDALLRSNALLGADSARHTYLACGLLARGDVLISDVQRNIERMRASMRMAWFNTDGFKTGICSQPPLDATRSVLALSNNCGIAQTFRRMETSFMRLYKVRAHLHHYTDIMGEAEGGVGLLAGAQEALATLIEDYEHMDGSDTPPEDWAGQGDAALLAAIGIGPTAAEAPATAGAAAAASSAGGRVA